MRVPVAGLVLLAAAANAAALGVVVERVESGGAAEKAGLRPGDLLEKWSRAASPPANPAPTSAPLASPFDLRLAELEQAPRGEVTVSGRRGDEPLQVAIPAGRWRLETRPVFSAGVLASYLDAEEWIASGDRAAGAASLERLAADARTRGEPVAAAWLLTRAASHMTSSETRSEGVRLLAAALEDAQAAGPPEVVALIHELIGEALKAQGRLDDARQAHDRAFAIRHQLAPDSLAVAASLKCLGSVVWRSGDLVGARPLWEASFALRSRLAPGSLDEAASLNALGILALDEGDLNAAEELYGRALTIAERRDPDSSEIAMILSNLVIVAHQRGDLVAAEGYGRRALAINERHDPHGDYLARSLSNLAMVSYSRGDLTTAEQSWRRALGLFEESAPRSLEVGAVLNNLGVVARKQGDLAAADDLLRRAMAVRQQIAPESLDVAMSLENLGLVAADRGDLAEAEQLYTRSLVMAEGLAPNSLQVAASLAKLGQAAMDRGDLDAADSLTRRALALREKLGPESQYVAQSLCTLGEVASRRGNLDAAESLHRRALAILEVLSPDSADEAQALHLLARVFRDRGELESAMTQMTRAVGSLENSLEGQGRVVERRGPVSESGLTIYRDLVDLLVDMDRPVEAFAVLERSRAQGLRIMLAERNLVFTADIPDELDRERRITAVEADRVLAELGGLSAFAGAGDGEDHRGIGGVAPADGSGDRERLLERLQQLRQRQEDIRARIRSASPRLAALTSPEPLDLEGTLAMLDPGTLLLAYSVGPENSYLFAVDADRRLLEVRELEADDRQLRSRVNELRASLRQPQSPFNALNRQCRELGDILLAPAANAIAAAARLVILPDGPLHLLPFGVLGDPAGGAEHGYLIESKPVTVVVSATVLDELKQSRRPDRPAQVVVFADPRYSAAAGGDASPEVVAALRAGLTLRPLPASRREAASLGRLYGSASRVWLGSDATEERVKAVGPETSILHLAAHGLVDGRLPLESAIAMAMPDLAREGQDNGLLQAWEVFEQVRLDAELVTLSACETALGEEVAGEGIVGLTRAFQYAGARTVLASLWGVTDDSTAELMDRFYRHIRAGKPKDEALRAAQIELLRAPLALAEGDGEIRELDARHPYHWAAFEVIGDWR